MKTTLTTFFLFFLIIPSFAQKKLQIDRFGKKKAMYYQVGDVLDFKLKGDDYFYSLPILDMDAEKQLLVFQTGKINIDDIIEIKKYRSRGAVNGFSFSFISFGTVWLGFTGIGALVGGPPVTVATGVIGGGFIILGGLVKLIFTKRKFRFDKRRKMRIVDLNLYGDLPSPKMACPCA